jgi:putative tryptophan/tyrosine transport system substrate-binding protein
MRRRAFITLLGGAAVGWPLAARAQQTNTFHRVGILWPSSPAANTFRLDALRNGLRELGYEEDRNIAFLQRGPEHQATQEGLTALAAELVQAKVDVILTAGTSPTRAAKSAAGMIPVVMTFVSDPIGADFVASLARPGGNITGLTNFGPELSGKWLELLKELSPQARNIGVLYDGAVREVVKGMQTRAAAVNVQLLPFEVNNDNSFADALAILPSRHPHALIVFLPPRNPELEKRIVQFAAVNRLPTMYWWREYVDGGGLVYYGPSVSEMYRRAAAFIDKILKGAKPAELPVEQPTRFDLVINLKTAKALGLEVPPTVLARADEVIE